MRERRCGHGKTFKKRCIECELVSLGALVKNAQANIERWTGEIAELQRFPPADPPPTVGGMED